MPKRNKGSKIGECVYCGERGPVSRDHIPPRNLFPPPRPGNLITVPACGKCNGGASSDDEYFRLAITTGLDPEKCASGFDLSIEAIHKLGVPEKIGFAKKMLSARRKVPVITPAGLYMEAGVLDIDPARLQRVISRVIRGLFFHHLSHRLPSDHTINIVSNWFTPDTCEELANEFQQIGECLSAAPLIEMGINMFSYRYRVDEDEADVSMWWLNFYNHRQFLCVT